MNIFKFLEQINTRPKPFEFYTAEELWTDKHTAAQMLQYHLSNVLLNGSSRILALQRAPALPTSAAAPACTPRLWQKPAPTLPASTFQKTPSTTPKTPQSRTDSTSPMSIKIISTSTPTNALT